MTAAPSTAEVAIGVGVDGDDKIERHSADSLGELGGFTQHSEWFPLIRPLWNGHRTDILIMSIMLAACRVYLMQEVQSFEPVRVQVLFDPALIAMLDSCRRDEPDLPSRSEFIRRAVRALASNGTSNHKPRARKAQRKAR